MTNFLPIYRLKLMPCVKKANRGEPRINVADIPARLLVEEGDQWKESSSARETLLLILRRATPQQRGQLAAVVRMGCRPGSGYTQENPLT
jgi:hypothetical protein